MEDLKNRVTKRKRDDLDKPPKGAGKGTTPKNDDDDPEDPDPPT